MDRIEPKSHAAQKEHVELAVAKLLRIGTGLATLLMAVGLALILLQAAPTVGSTLVTAGLIALVCTPLMRVAAAFWIYLQEGDRTYAFISLTVLLIVLAGIVMGRAH